MILESLEKVSDPKQVERSEESPKTSADPSSKHHPKPGLYLKVAGEEDLKWIQVKKDLAIFDGIVPLYVVFQKEKKFFRAPRSMAVDVNEPLLRELRRLLGDENVAFVEQ